jgi:hypothetical protein
LFLRLLLRLDRGARRRRGRGLGRRLFRLEVRTQFSFRREHPPVHDPDGFLLAFRHEKILTPIEALV